MLEQNPDASLAFSFWVCIDGNGKEVRRNEIGTILGNSQKMILQNRRQRISFQPSAIYTHGIIRSKLFDVSLVTNRYGVYEDVFLLRWLAACGPFLIYPRVMFKKRIHKEIYSGSEQYKKENKNINCFLASRALAKRANLSFFETLSLWLTMVYFFHIKRLGIKNWYRTKKLSRMVFESMQFKGLV